MVDSETSSLQGGRSRRAWTVSAESEAMESSGRSNGPSSIDSNTERPKTQAGEGPDSEKARSGSISKLLNSRRRRKKKNQKYDDEVPPVPGMVTEFDLQESRSNDSRDSNSVMTPSNNSLVPPEGDVVNLLTDDSEPERYAFHLTRLGHLTDHLQLIELLRLPLTTPTPASIPPPPPSSRQHQSIPRTLQ